MISVDGSRPKWPRHKGDLRRRQALADAAAGVSPGGAGIPAETVRIERFRCVIYLRGFHGSDLTMPRRACTEYAEAFGWEITDVIEEHTDTDAETTPQARGGLTRAIAYVENGAAGAVLTAQRSMISIVPQECDEITRDVEAAGGFLQVMDSARGIA